MSAPENPPAFPASYGDASGISVFHGMSLRDWFAGQALAGMLGNVPWTDALVKRNGTNKDRLLEDMSGQCYDIADAMLKERAK